MTWKKVMLEGDVAVLSDTAPSDVDFAAGTLPPFDHISINIVDKTLNNKREIRNLDPDSVRIISYKPKFKLDYISIVR